MPTRTINISLAGYLIRLRFEERDEFKIYEENIVQKSLSYYKNFIVKDPGKPDFLINVRQTQYLPFAFDFSQKIQYLAFYQKKSNFEITTYYYISSLQLRLLIKSVLSNLLVNDGGFILHSSASLINKKADIFVGRAGAGKSTIISLFSKKYRPLADDTMIIKKVEGKYISYQTPFVERTKSIKKANHTINLGKIYILKQSPLNKITKITNKKTLFKHLYHDTLWKNNYLSKRLMVNIASFINEFNYFYELKFNLTNPKELISLLKRSEVPL